MCIVNPDISILLPFYNTEKTLSRALESISAQTFANFECILINNNSSDRSLVIAKDCCMADQRFRLITEKKQGIVFALNKGLEMTRARYIARMDADDWCYPYRLERQYNYLEKNKICGVVAGTVKYWPNPKNTAGFNRYVRWSNSILEHNDIYARQFVESPIVHPSVMWRKEISEKFGAYAFGGFPEDYELWLRWLAKGVKFHKIKTPVIRWYDTKHRLSRKDPHYDDLAFFTIKSKYLASWLKNYNPHHPNVMVWGASKISRKRADLLEKFGIYISGYIDITKKRQLNKSIIYYQDIPQPYETFILVYLKEETMRLKTVNFLEERGFVEGRNYLLIS